MSKNKVRYPKEVPILSARDICRGWADGPNGNHCLWGWNKVVFGPSASMGTRPYDLLQAAVVRASQSMHNDMTDFNDDKVNSKRKIAAVWNEVMVELGYTEVTDV